MIFGIISISIQRTISRIPDWVNNCQLTSRKAATGYDAARCSAKYKAAVKDFGKTTFNLPIILELQFEKVKE